MTKSKSYLFAILAASLWGTTFAFGKMVVPDPLNPFVFNAIRTFFGGIVLVLFIAATGRFHEWLKVFRKQLPTFAILGGVFYSGAYLIQYWGLSLTSAINQSIICNTQTIWVVVFNFLIFHKKPRRIFILGFILAFIGVSIVILGDNSSVSKSNIIGDIISLFAFILWGGYTAFTKPVSTKEEPLFVTTSIIICANVVLIPLAFFFELPTQILVLTPIQWGIMLYMGVICVGVTFILWTMALSNKEISSEYVAIITMMEPVIGIITSIAFLGEILTISTFLGCVIVLIGLLLANSEHINPSQKEDSPTSIKTDTSDPKGENK